MAKICIFTGSTLPESTDKTLLRAMEGTAQTLADLGHDLIMGGMASGCMKLIGSAYLQAGGKAMTIIYPEEFAAYEEKQEHPNLTHVRVPNLHQRLETMIATADAFIAFPGGIGTIHEVAQVIADNQACLYHTGTTRKVKPQIIYNHHRFFDGLLQQYKRSSERGYIKPEHSDLIVPVVYCDDIIRKLLQHMQK